MARVESLSILLDPAGQDFLDELYGGVIENVEKTTLAMVLKNRELSGDPDAGSYEVKRFANSQSQDYGTARTAGKGSLLKAEPITVQINVNKEIPEEIEQKDIMFYGVQGLLQRRSANHARTMTRELERAFFTTASAAAVTVTTTATEPEDILEALVLQIENTQNDYVDGVPRDMINVIMQSTAYSAFRNRLNMGAQNANVDSAAEQFTEYNGVKVYSSTYLPADVDMIAMIDGAIAQPVKPRPYQAERIPLSEAYAVTLFYYYGTMAVMPDLIAKIVSA